MKLKLFKDKQGSKEQDRPMKKGYKCFNKDLKCRSFQFEVGKTYEVKGALKLCSNGFHFCEKPADVFNYYDFDPSNRVCEVEAFGEIAGEGDKHCTSNIRIVKELTWSEVLELCNTGKGNTGLKNSGNCNSGNCNSGDYNSGSCNSGSCNSGNCNSGSCNSGSCNSGDYNSGYRNSGNCNSGDYNSGDYNSGDCNSGNRNSGYRNSGNCNSGDYNSGLFNTNEPNLRLFNKQTKIRRDDPRIQAVLNLPGPRLTEWIYYDQMNDAEKKQYPKAETCGGYVKTLSYKEAWLKYWGNASESAKEAYLNLPFFDAKIFEEITGIKVEQPKKRKKQ